MTRTTPPKKLAATLAMALGLSLLLVALIGAKPAQAAYPGVNGPIAYTAPGTDTGYGHEQIYVVSPSGGTPTQVTTDGTEKDFPDFSSDGTEIAYQARYNNGDIKGSSPGYSQIYVVPSSGGTPTQITSDSTDHYHPDFSPDGTKIAYDAKDSSGNEQIYVIPSSGGTPTQVTFDSTYHEAPVFSPDGTKIAYDALDSVSGNSLYVVPSSGGTPTQITGGGASYPDYSPDGTKITYRCVDNYTNTQICVIPSSGGTPAQITSDKDFWHDTPVFSPDGTEIAYVSPDSNNVFDQIYVVPSSGGTPTQITSDGCSSSGCSPDWGPAPSSGGGGGGGGGTGGGGGGTGGGGGAGGGPHHKHHHKHHHGHYHGHH